MMESLYYPRKVYVYVGHEDLSGVGSASVFM
jgi:hypothetical protein